MNTHHCVCGMHDANSIDNAVDDDPFAKCEMSSLNPRHIGRTDARAFHIYLTTYNFRHFNLPTLAQSLYLSGTVSRTRRRQNDYDNGDNDSIAIRVRKHIDSMYEIASPCLQTSPATSHCHSKTNQSKHPPPFHPPTPPHTTHRAMRRNLDVVLFTQVVRVTDLSISSHVTINFNCGTLWPVADNEPSEPGDLDSRAKFLISWKQYIAHFLIAARHSLKFRKLASNQPCQTSHYLYTI